MFSSINHMKMHKALDMKPTKILKLVNDENWEILKSVSYCDDACRMGLFDKKKFKDIIKNMEKIKKQWGNKTLEKTNKLVDGKLVIKTLNIRPSKRVGDIINQVTKYIIDDGLKDSIVDLIKKADREIK